jgi:hypothetical protein
MIIILTYIVIIVSFTNITGEYYYSPVGAA